MSKNLSYLLILLSVVAAVGAILIWQNGSSGILVLENIKLPARMTETLDEETLATWQTYGKEGFDFQLKYPQPLSYKYDSVWSPEVESPRFKKTLNAVFESDNFDLTLVLNAPNAQATSSKAEFLRQKTANIAGQTVSNKIYREPNGDIVSLAVFEKNSNFYIIWATIIADKDNNLKTFSQIISTFEFSN